MGYVMSQSVLLATPVGRGLSQSSGPVPSTKGGLAGFSGHSVVAISCPHVPPLWLGNAQDVLSIPYKGGPFVLASEWLWASAIPQHTEGPIPIHPFTPSVHSQSLQTPSEGHNS